MSWTSPGSKPCCRRGGPLADVDSELLALRQAPRLAELRLQALETRIDAELHLGRHAEVIAELGQLIGDHPLRERPRAQLMLALYRDGRQGEALAAYQAARQVLARELGIGPGAELRELHQRVLTGDPALAAPPTSAAPVARGTPVVPRELPAPVTHFAGRAAELEALTGLLDRAGHAGHAGCAGCAGGAARAGSQAPATLVISAAGGTAGVGKTALAVHWAHQVAGRFPDGQLYVNLRGDDRPVPPAEALAAFLRSLGVPDPEIPPEEAERAARYRSLLAGRTMLIVLDNAGSAEQVRPLLPGAASCAVLVTSREALAGLVARDGAARLDLDLLPLPEAVGLLRDLVGGRVDADPAAAAMLAGQCARLPLTLRVAAELAAARPGVPLSALAAELAGHQRRPDRPATGAPARAVFAWACRELDAGTVRAFRLMALCPGPDLDAYATAALIGSGPDEGRRVLGRLAAAHLAQPTGPGRYAQHDLVRAYAGDLATAQDGDSDRHDALTRLFGYYLAAAAAAMDTLFPARGHRRPPVPSGLPVPPLADPAAALDWLDAHRAHLVAVAAHAATRGWPGHAVRLAAIVSRYVSGPEAAVIHTSARDAAREAGDRGGEAAAASGLGVI